MAKMDIRNSTASDMTNRVDEWQVEQMHTDGVSSQEETIYQNTNWGKQWGYFNKIPEVKSTILMKAIWNVGKGYTTEDPATQVILDHILGWGKDTFLDILFNMEVTKRIGGDAFAEIIKDDAGTLINLKPLDPASMRIIVDNKGRIKRFEQTSKLGGKDKDVIPFQPEEIFYLANNRLADQIHGISDIDAMEDIIKADKENFEDIKKVMHRQAKPLIMFKLGTDKQSDIDAFIAKMDAATNKGENIYIPDDENAVRWEVIQVQVSQMIMEWRNDLRNKFYRAVGMPQVIFGQAQATESGGKIEYLAHEQVFEKDQKHLEEQIWQQLQLKINLIPPVSLLDNLQTDQAKDANQGMEIQPQDVTAGKG